MKTKIELSTSLVPILDVGMYGTHLEPDAMLMDFAMEYSEELEEKYWKLFSLGKYRYRVRKCAKGIMEADVLPILKGLNLGVTGIEVGEIVSPRECNLSADRLDFDIITDDFYGKAMKWVKDNGHNEIFIQFLKDNYSSYSGFISFMPNSIPELLKLTESEVYKLATPILSFLLRDNMEAMKDALIEDVNEDLDLRWFVPDSDEGAELLEMIDKEYEKIKIKTKTKLFTKYEAILKEGFITENQLNALRKAIHAGKIDGDELSSIHELIHNGGEGIALTIDHITKGAKWLNGLHKTPKGKERKNNPYGYREIKAIEDLREIRLKGLYDTSRYGSSYEFFVPIYEVIGHGCGFEYYMSLGKIHITG